MDSALADQAARTDSDIPQSEPVSESLRHVTEPHKARWQSRYVAARTEYLRHTGKDPASLTQETIEAFEQSWQSLDSRLAIIPGKEVLSLLNQELQQHHGITLTHHALIDAFSPTDIPPELSEALSRLAAFAQ